MPKNAPAFGRADSLFFLNCPRQQKRDHCAKGAILFRCHLPQLICKLARHNTAHHNAALPLIFCCTVMSHVASTRRAMLGPGRSGPAKQPILPSKIRMP
jgi:hypothetical protein